MSIGGVVRLFKATPQGSVGDGGRMALADHLRELRARLMRSVAVFVVFFVVGLFFYDQLLDAVMGPYTDAVEALDQEVQSSAYIKGAAGPLLLQLKLSGLAAIVVSSPYWLYQIWAFIVPGLHAHEKRWSKLFMAVAGPLFALGVATGYYVLPKGLEVLIGFTPDRLENLVEFGEYFSFFTRMLLIFGVSFEIPLFVVLLNLAGVVSAKSLGDHRPWIILGTFIFAAVATPSTDPFSMIMLAAPMTLLFLASELIARFTDRRRRRRDEAETLGDDEATPVDRL
ncbi:MAG TPA: twin-arginine translocase subunit TatC [Nocardioidaceae bacterium]|nr:twin-arginine translocase subunit TatC [Nocardioidaceae bacterium]